MNKQYDVTPEAIKKARVPHEILLTNLIFNHILLFAATLSASSLWKFVALVPIGSALTLLYIFWAARRARSRASWFANGHWQITARRSMMFLGLIGFVSGVFGVLYLVSGGDFRPLHWALGGATILPVLVTVLVLVVLESDALYQAKQGILPDRFETLFPDNVPPVIAIIDHNKPHEEASP